jgi:N,N'-diacetyllegionaminate synthase
MRPVLIGDRLVGDGHPVFIIAEIGYNFNTIEEGVASIDRAVECGVDAVKFQSFKPETLTTKSAAFPEEAGGVNQWEEFDRYQMSEETHRILFDHARKRGVIFFSTPSYYDDVDLLERLGVSLYKIGSDDLTNLPFIKYIAEKGKPVIFSTGMGTMAEIAEAFDTIASTGNDKAMMLYCVSNYPIKDTGLLDLKVIDTFKSAFGIPVGLSDHTTIIGASIAAVALGASIIERHFVIDKNLNVPDAFFSADPTEMKLLVDEIRNIEKTLGNGLKQPTATETEMRLETRKSMIARRNIAKGEVITKDMFIIKRPGTGILPKFSDLVIGRRAKNAIAEDSVITWDSLD